MLVSVLRTIARLPLRWLHVAGVALGWITYALSPAYAARMRDNLRASGVCAGDAACKALRRRVVAETGKGALELPAVWFGNEDKVTRLVVECHGWGAAEEARARGKGIIFLTPHLGCFEICALYVAQRMPITSLYRPPKLAWIEPLMVSGRSRWQARVAPANLRGVRMLYKALARGEAIGLLPDQVPGVGEGVWAEFFGRPAYTMTLVSRLVQKCGAPVIMVFGERLETGRGYRLHFEQLPEGELDEPALNRAVEAQVRRKPEQYLWSYNRYKVPAGAEPPPDEGKRAQ